MSYSPTLGRWMEEDPAGYVDGTNLYQTDASNPISNQDPTGLASEKPTVTSISVGSSLRATASREKLDVTWDEIDISGTHLTDAEFTQYVSSTVNIYEPKRLMGNVEGDRDIIVKYFDLDNIGGQIPPFASNLKDTGWGEGDNWESFNLDDGKSLIRDHHELYSLYQPNSDDNDAKYWQFERKLSFTIKVRCKISHEIIGSYSWGYTYRNFKQGQFPIKDDSAAGIYDWYGITRVPQSIAKGTPTTQPTTSP